MNVGLPLTNGSLGVSTLALPTMAGALPASATSTLLPPSTANASSLDVVVGKLLAMSSALGEAQMKLGMTSASAADGARRAASAARKEALERAAEAAREAQEEASNRGLFDFITDNIGVVGLIGIVTFQPSLVAADVAAHEAGLTDGDAGLLDVGAAIAGGPLAYVAGRALDTFGPEWLKPEDVAAFALGGPLGSAIRRAVDKALPEDFAKTLEELSHVKDDDVRAANKIALTVALTAAALTGSVLTAGAMSASVVALVGVGISAGTQLLSSTGALKELVGEKAAMWISLAGAAVGAALTIGASLGGVAANAGSIAKAGVVIRGTASALKGADQVVQGLRELEVAKLARESSHAEADAEERKHTLARIERIVDGILDDLREVKESSQRTSEVLQGIQQTHLQTMLQAGAMKA